MDIIKENNRVYAEAGGKTIAEATFPDKGEDAVEIDHTFVDDSLRGQGIASRLIRAAVEVAEARGKKIVPACSYAISWMKKHPEFSFLIK